MGVGDTTWIIGDLSGLEVTHILVFVLSLDPLAAQVRAWMLKLSTLSIPLKLGTLRFASRVVRASRLCWRSGFLAVFRN